MGQSSSKPEDGSAAIPGKGSLVQYFDERCLSQFTTAELMSFKSNIPEGKIVDDELDVADVTRMYHIPAENGVLVSVFLNMLRTLTNFPLIQDSYNGLTYRSILKMTLLLDKARAVKYVKWNGYDAVKMLFISLSLDKSVKVESMTDSSALLDNKDYASVVETYNSIDVDELSVDANSLLNFLSLLLALSRKSVLNNCRIDHHALATDLELFKSHALTFIRTMNTRIVTLNDCKSSFITFEQFSTTIYTVAPNLLSPLQLLLEHVLYSDRDRVEQGQLQPIGTPSKIVDEPGLAQLATFFPREIVYSCFQRLYVGRDSGFSMRSFQSKVFKWMAPSILFVEGMRVKDEADEEKDSFANNNPRYRSFIESYGKLKDEDQHLDELSKRKRKLLFAVYVQEPWKVSNKDLFGGSATKIIQLHPRQEVFDADPFKTGNIYFNTVGGGIGIGNQQVFIKGNTKKYFPGNVSLTIDSSLEFGVFRHLGPGGHFCPGRLLKERGEADSSFEYRFIIQDLEVWGCGGEEELEEQVKQWQWEEVEAKRRQHVNLQSLGEDRALLEMAGLVGQHQSGGSV